MPKKKELEQPIRFLYDGVMPKFWPPRPNAFWRMVIHPFRCYFADHIWRVKDIQIEGLSQAFDQFGPEDGILIAPNHSHEADAHVLIKAASQVKSQFYFMAAWQSFTRNKGLDGWVLQRMGVFSVDREGTDRRSLRYAMDLLADGQKLVIFPEGEIHHLNDRLKPILDGVAFIALKAQKQLIKENKNGRIWILPAAIHYEFSQDVTVQMEAAMKKLEQRLFWWKPKPGASLVDRILDFGDALLTIKEKEKMGESFDHLPDLATRLTNFINALLIRHEEEYLGKSAADKSVPLRVKSLRRKCIDIFMDEALTHEQRQKARLALDDIQLALQLSSYPGDYIRENPVPERMAETIEKYMEDVFNEHHSIGIRRAKLTFGTPMNMLDAINTAQPKAPSLVTSITEKLEQNIQSLMNQE